MKLLFGVLRIMKKQLCKIFSLVFCFIVIFSSFFVVPSQAAENDFSMKQFDKAYITFLFDDGRMPFTKECFELFQQYDMDICCAVVADEVKGNQSVIDLLMKIQNAGGEIVSHTYGHDALTSNNSTLENIEKELGDSFRVLKGLGFNVNGIVEAGNGGGEKTADYELIETVSRKYYKYSNAYGVSPQYKMSRTWLSGKNVDNAKSLVHDAIQNKKWVMFWAHDFSEFSKSDMMELLDYIEVQGKNKVEVKTWNEIYVKFGNYTGPQVPTVEAIESVCATQGHDLKNAVVEKAATCEDGPVMKGECKRCGKTATNQSKNEALGHKFEKYISDNNSDCTKYGTKTAKCSNKGCNATDTKTDYESGKKKHDLKTVTVKEATKTTDGLAEIKCSNCGYVDKKVTIPKGKDAEDVVSSELIKNDTSDTTESDSQGQGTSSDDSSSKNENNTQEEQSTNNSNKTDKKMSGLTILLIAISVLLVASTGVFVFFIIKIIRK